MYGTDVISSPTHQRTIRVACLELICDRPVAVGR